MLIGYFEFIKAFQAQFQQQGGQMIAPGQPPRQYLNISAPGTQEEDEQGMSEEQKQEKGSMCF